MLERDVKANNRILLPHSNNNIRTQLVQLYNVLSIKEGDISKPALERVYSVDVNGMKESEAIRNVWIPAVKKIIHKVFELIFPDEPNLVKEMVLAGDVNVNKNEDSLVELLSDIALCSQTAVEKDARDALLAILAQHSSSKEELADWLSLARGRVEFMQRNVNLTGGLGHKAYIQHKENFDSMVNGNTLAGNSYATRIQDEQIKSMIDYIFDTCTFSSSKTRPRATISFNNEKIKILNHGFKN